MKWQAEPKKIIYLPKNGDKRIVKRFALFPTRLENDQIIWLESYCKEQRYFYSYGLGQSTWDTIRKFQ
jgi:hypothetical protein